ncbi:MAG: biotin/lipoyl-containing protein [Candidatus Zixiibacteriota bacterium]
MKYIAKVKEKTFKIDIEEKDGKLEVRLNGKPVLIDLIEVKPPNFLSLLVNNRSFDAEILKDSERYWVSMRARRFECELEDERVSKLKELSWYEGREGVQRELKSPMPGLVVAIEIKEGQEVKPGDGLVIVEAMKMENELKASFKGKVKSIIVKEGQAVEKDEVLIVFE